MLTCLRLRLAVGAGCMIKRHKLQLSKRVCEGRIGTPCGNRHSKDNGGRQPPSNIRKLESTRVLAEREHEEAKRQGQTSGQDGPHDRDYSRDSTQKDLCLKRCHQEERRIHILRRVLVTQARLLR